MAVYQIAHFDAKPDAVNDLERTLHDHASFVRQQLPGTYFTVYRDAATPTRYLAVTRSEKPTPELAAFAQALAPYLAGAIASSEYQLVTSSDLAPRHRRR